MPLELFNTLSGKVEPLYASDGKALRFYCCGPTVYDFGHIGNFRTFLHVDVLRRVIKLHGIADCAVFGIPDSEYGESICAAVKLEPNAKLSESDIRAHVREHLAASRSPS